MKIILSEKISRILSAKINLEKVLKIKIEHKGEEIIINGSPEQEYIAEKVIDAINMGFPVAVALTISTEDYFFEVIPIKEYTKRKDLQTIRARIIGEKGSALRTLSELTECHFEISGNSIGIIGAPENIPNAHDAIINLIRGSKHANVYAYLEHHKPEPILDYGIKEQEKRKKKEKTKE